MTTLSDKKFQQRRQGFDNFFFWQLVGASTTIAARYFDK
jgi:hypothetical protein